jgi:pSer/pThr/pTyr-binding forkhead associated (FHA) protein
VLSAGPLRGKTFIFQQDKIKLGRGPENDLSIPGDLKMSREHALVEVSGKAVYIKSLNEKNPIWVDGEWVQKKQIPPGAQIRLGDTEIRFMFNGGVSTAVRMTDSFSLDSLGVGNLAAKPLTVKPLPLQSGVHRQKPPLVTHHGPRGGLGVARTKVGAQQSGSSGNRAVFYLIVALVIGGAVWLNNQGGGLRPRGLELRDKVASESAIQGSIQEVEKLEKEISKTGRDTVQFRLAEEQFHRGFRDYLNGHYSRAMEQFQAALSFFPEHRQSRRYFHLARRKFDQQIQSYMRQGQRYYGVQNYRLCVAFYSKVLTMVRDQNSPQYREALQFVRECQAKIQAGGL